MAHWKLVVDGFDELSGDVKNIFYVTRADENAPTGEGLITCVYNLLKTHFVATFHIITVTRSTWEGPADGEWWELGTDGKRHPKKAPPWGVGVPHTLTTEFTGASGEEALPPQVAAYVFLKTGVPHDIGKKYFGDLNVTDVIGGEPTTALGTALSSVSTALMAPMTEGPTPYTFEVWGPIHGFQAITAALSGKYFGTQRRRKPQVGS